VKSPGEHRPIEIAPERAGRAGEWTGFAVLLLAVGAVMGALLLWLSGSFLIAAGVTIGMIAAMLFLGWLTSGTLDRRR